MKIKWIPCSEHYPAREGRYLVTVGAEYPLQDYSTSCANWLIDEDGSGAFYFCECGSNYTFTELGYRIVAWAELPDPWRGDE